MDLETAVAKITEAAHEARDAAREATTAANGAKAAANAATSAIHDVRRDQRIQRRDFLILWQNIYGPNRPPPPPPPPGVDPLDPAARPDPSSDPPLAFQVDGAEDRAVAAHGDSAELRGMVLAIQAEMHEQSKKLGVGKRGIASVITPANLGRIAAIVGAIGVIVANVRASGAPTTAPATAPTLLVIPAAPVGAAPFDAGAPTP